MGFLSLEFLLFLIPVWFIHWVIPYSKITSRNILLLIGSYIFYSSFGFEFLMLLMISTVFNFSFGLIFERLKKKKIRLPLLVINILANLSLLFFYKISGKLNGGGLIIPVGISFFTFQALSYILDVYRGNFIASKNIISFSLYIAFFPQLVAGPIEKPNKLIPLFEHVRKINWENITLGLRLILLGMFKKIVIADNLGLWVDNIFSNIDSYHGGVLLLGPFLYGLQIYADFSGYTLIARGLGKMFEINLSRNFKFPFFSTNPKEFWNKWHITLKNWFFEYVYLPLGGNRGELWQRYFNILIIFILSGIWHGIGFNFLLWGLSNAIIYLLFTFYKPKNTFLSKTLSWFLTCSLISLTWIFFRSVNVNQSIKYFEVLIFKLFSQYSFIEMCAYLYWQIPNTYYFAFLLFLIIEIIGHKKGDENQIFKAISFMPLRWILYFIIIFNIVLLEPNNIKLPFIYFRF